MTDTKENNTGPGPSGKTVPADSDERLKEKGKKTAIDELEKTLTMAPAADAAEQPSAITDYNGAAVLDTPADNISSATAAEADTIPDNKDEPPPAEVLFDDAPEPPVSAAGDPDNTFTTLSDEDLDQAAAEAESTPKTAGPAPESTDNGKAQLDKDDIADELEYALNATIFSDMDKTTDTAANATNRSPAQDQDTVATRKASLDKEDMPDDIFSADKAALDQDGIQDAISNPDKAVLDIEGLPDTHQKPAAAPTATDSKTDKAAAPEIETPKTFLQKMIARARSLTTAQKAILISSAFTVLILCIGGLIVILFSGPDSESPEDIFSKTEPAAPKAVPDIPLVKNYQLETFVIPMQASEKGTCFFKADFMLTFNQTNAEELKALKTELRKTVYDFFYNKDSALITNKLKRSEQIFRLKNVLNLLFKKDAVKNIAMINHKIV